MIHGLLQQVAEGGIDCAVFFHLRHGHARIGGELSRGKAFQLKLACLVDALANDRGGFARAVVVQFGNGESGGFNVEIDAIKQRPADARAVTLDLRRGTAALVLRVTEVAAGAFGRCQFAIWGAWFKTKKLQTIRRNLGRLTLFGGAVST